MKNNQILLIAEIPIAFMEGQQPTTGTIQGHSHGRKSLAANRISTNM